MQIVTIFPPLIKGNVGSADEGKCIVIDLAVQRREGLVYLSYVGTSHDVQGEDNKIGTYFSEQLAQPVK